MQRSAQTDAAGRLECPDQRNNQRVSRALEHRLIGQVFRPEVCWANSRDIQIRSTSEI